MQSMGQHRADSYQSAGRHRWNAHRRTGARLHTLRGVLDPDAAPRDAAGRRWGAGFAAQGCGAAVAARKARWCATAGQYGEQYRAAAWATRTPCGWGVGPRAVVGERDRCASRRSWLGDACCHGCVRDISCWSSCHLLHHHFPYPKVRAKSFAATLAIGRFAVPQG